MHMSMLGANPPDSVSDNCCIKIGQQPLCCPQRLAPTSGAGTTFPAPTTLLRSTQCSLDGSLSALEDAGGGRHSDTLRQQEVPQEAIVHANQLALQARARHILDQHHLKRAKQEMKRHESVSAV